MKMFSLLLAVAGLFFYQPKSYTDALRDHTGESYFDTSCSGLLCKAHDRISELRVHCTALQFWTGCNGNLTQVAQADTLANLDLRKAKAGDVLAVNGVHVIAYLGDGQCMDSDPLHDGVKEASISELTARKNDAWFSGPVRIQRWKQ